jgi:apolipoprotein N-acyltransferase
LGCAAPGIGFWQMAWFCLAPLLFMISAERSLPRSFVYGFLFGLAYNCLYLKWLLGLAPLDWLGFNASQGQLLADSALLITASHQALLIAIFSFFYCLLLKITARFNRTWLRNDKIIGLLHILIVPLLWILITNKIGNAHYLTGVPWSMLEYTQFKQLNIIQVADLIGGIGICYLIVMVNTLLAQIFYAFVAESSQHLNIFGTIKSTINDNWPAFLLCSSLLGGTLFYGHKNLASEDIQASVPQASDTQTLQSASIVQPNINIEMEKTKKQYSIEELLTNQLNLSNNCPPGLCVWTESALPVRLGNNSALQSELQNFALQKKLSLVVGTIDQDSSNNLYNAAWAVSSTGQISKTIYHKRYLVPFGEYTPVFVRNWPGWILSLTNTPAGSGYASGDSANLLEVDNKIIAPLICFEVISPELTAASVRAGGQLLVNINDLAWFHKSIIGQQMIACAVLRAVENRRDFIFAANTGPSAFISSKGKVKSYLGQNKAGNLINKVNYSSELSPFTRWFVF